MHMTTLFRVVVVTLALVAGGAAFALELDDAKRDGLVGEEWSGYVGVVGEPDPQVAALVRDVNERRRAEYERVAGQNNLNLRDVEEIAGRRLIERTPPGGYVRLPERGWVQK
jgi:uncharacterized protein